MSVSCVQLYSFIILLMIVYILASILLTMYTLFAGVCGDVISFSRLTA